MLLFLDQCISFRCRVNQAGHYSGIGRPLVVIMVGLCVEYIIIFILLLIA